MTSGKGQWGHPVQASLPGPASPLSACTHIPRALQPHTPNNFRGRSTYPPTPQTSIMAESWPSEASTHTTGAWVNLRWVSQTRASRNCLWGPRDKISINLDILTSWLQTAFITMVSCGFQNKLWRAREPYPLDRWEHEGVESLKISYNLGTEKLCGGQHLTEALRISCG